MTDFAVWLVFGLNLICAAVNLCTLLDARRRIRDARAEEAARAPTDWNAIIEAELSGPEGDPTNPTYRQSNRCPEAV